jgi:hypothetical protein
MRQRLEFRSRGNIGRNSRIYSSRFQAVSEGTSTNDRREALADSLAWQWSWSLGLKRQQLAASIRFYWNRITITVSLYSYDDSVVILERTISVPLNYAVGARSRK